MPEYTLYVDGSTECQDIEKQLEVSGLQFISIQRESGGRMVPVLIGPAGVFEGTANIKLYFLARRASHTAP